MAKILLSISDSEQLSGVKKALTQAGYLATAASQSSSLRAQVSVQNPDLVIADGDVVENEGEELKKLFPDKPLIGWTSQRNAKAAVELINAGAFDCLSAPLQTKELLGVVEYSIKRTKVIEHEESILRKHIRKTTAGISAAALVLAAIFLAVNRNTTSEPRTFTLNFQNPTGIFCLKNRIWISDWYTQSIYRFKAGASNITLEKTYYFQGNNPYSSALINGFLWVTDTGGNIRRYELERDEPVFHGSFKSQGLAPTGLCLQDNYVWSVDAEANAIFQHPMGDPSSVIMKYSYPGLMPVGFYWDGEYFWSADGKTGKIYKHYGPEREFYIIAMFTIVPEGGGTLSGLSGSGKNLWLIFTGQPAKVMRYPISKLK